jgi:hypothetical protein
MERSEDARRIEVAQHILCDPLMAAKMRPGMDDAIADGIDFRRMLHRSNSVRDGGEHLRNRCIGVLCIHAPRLRRDILTGTGDRKAGILRTDAAQGAIEQDVGPQRVE